MAKSSSFISSFCTSCVRLITDVDFRVHFFFAPGESGGGLSVPAGCFFCDLYFRGSFGGTTGGEKFAACTIVAVGIDDTTWGDVIAEPCCDVVACSNRRLFTCRFNRFFMLSGDVWLSE